MATHSFKIGGNSKRLSIAGRGHTLAAAAMNSREGRLVTIDLLTGKRREVSLKPGELQLVGMPTDEQLIAVDHSKSKLVTIEPEGTIRALPLSVDGAFQDAHLSPGGRFLAVYCTELDARDRPEVQVFDLVALTKQRFPAVSFGFITDDRWVVVPPHDDKPAVWTERTPQSKSAKRVPVGLETSRGFGWLSLGERVITHSAGAFALDGVSEDTAGRLIGRWEDLLVGYELGKPAAEVQLRDGQRKLRTAIPRPRTSRIDQTLLFSKFAALVSGAYVEVYDLEDAARLEEAPRPKKRAPARRAPVKALPSTSTSSDDPIRARIWKAPQDRKALSVWADHLIEQGDPRGEFIALSIRVQTASAAERPALEKERKKMIRSRGAQFLGAARPLVNLFSFDDWGLLESVEVQAPKVSAALPSLLALTPRMRLSISQLSPLSRLTGLDRVDLSEVWVVNFEGNPGLTEAALERLSPALVSARGLWFGDPITQNRRPLLPDQALSAFLGKTRRLEELSVERAAVVLEAPRLPKLRTLSINEYVPPPQKKALEDRYPTVTLHTPSFDLREYLKR